MKSFKKTGMTLVELMVVVAIVALLMGIMAYYVLGRRQNNAQVDLANEVFALLQAQRTRAMSMNVATYVRFIYEGNTVSSITPRIGENSICSSAGQLPVLYTNSYSADNIVAIDIVHTLSNNRTLDSYDTNKYISSSDESLTSISVKTDNNNVAFDEAQHDTSFDICFQPNGQAMFLRNAVQPAAVASDSDKEDNEILFNVHTTRIEINTADSGSGGTYVISVTGLGMIHSGT